MHNTVVLGVYKSRLESEFCWDIGYIIVVNGGYSELNNIIFVDYMIFVDYRITAKWRNVASVS